MSRLPRWLSFIVGSITFIVAMMVPMFALQRVWVQVLTTLVLWLLLRALSCIILRKIGYVEDFV
jgi:hypothetical protein